MEEKKRKMYRNYVRSDRAIIHAYVELMQTKPNGRITVTDIVEKADLNRSTFYAHFKSSTDVRDRIHSDITDKIVGSLHREDYKNTLSDPTVLLRSILNLLRSDEDLYRMLLRTDGAWKFLKSIEGVIIENYMSDEVIIPMIPDRDEFELNMRMVIGGFISVLQDWASGQITIPLDKLIELIGNTIKHITALYVKKSVHT